MYKNKY